MVNGKGVPCVKYAVGDHAGQLQSRAGSAVLYAFPHAFKLFPRMITATLSSIVHFRITNNLSPLLLWELFEAVITVEIAVLIDSRSPSVIGSRLALPMGPMHVLGFLLLHA